MRSRLHRNRLNTKRDSFYDEPPPVDYSWLYPIMMPSIFPTLFSLYREHYSKEDDHVGHVMSELDRYDDEKLSRILQVRR